jgi:putative peptidoglycan lipid II flippase
MILYLLLFRNYNILGLTIANVIGNFFRVAVQVPSLVKHGYRYKFLINFNDRRLKEVVILIVPVVIGAGANSLNLFVDQYIASSLQSGSISALNFAQKLIIFINTIIVTSVNSIVYPLMANMRNNEDKRGFLDIFKKSVLYLGILLIPITIGIVIYNKEIISIAYERGVFDAKAVEATSPALLGYGFGIFFTGIRDILNSTLFTMGKTKITTINGIIGVIINIIFCIILSKYMGLMGIALASVIAMAVTAILLFRSIVKLEKSLIIKDLVKKIGLITINSLIMGLIIITLVVYLKNKLSSLTILLLGVIVGSIVYFILCYLFRIEEVIEIKDFILKKINR